jgi:tetratricopeptide (TPR) repeat protein
MRIARKIPRSEEAPTPAMVFVGPAAEKPKGMGGRRLSVILFGGALCALLMMAAVLVGRYIHIFFDPTIENTERLLTMGKPKDAMALLGRMEKGVGRADSKQLVLRGKALYAILMERLSAEKWGRYGVNPENWLADPLAAEAEQCFLDAMAASPEDPEIRLVLGNLYREQGRFGDAELILRSSLEIDDENAEAYLALGLLYAEGAHIPAAHNALAAAWDLDRGNPKIAKNIAYFHRFYANEPESSIVWFNRYLNANPQRDPDINLVRGELSELIERYPEYERYKVEPGANVNRGAGRNFTQWRRPQNQ